MTVRARRHRARVARCLRATLVVVLTAATTAARAAPAVLIWPRTPSAPTAATTVDARAAGVRVVPFAAIAARLESAAAAESAAESAALEAVQTELVAAREAFLDQRFDAMLDALARAELAGLPAFARREHVGLAWELSLQRGIAYLLRAREGDAARAAERFGLALALRPDARPDRAVYGPDITHAFVQSVAARAALSPRPVRLVVEPAHAAVTIDGAPVVEPGRPRALHPGLHLLAAEAPGYQPNSAIVSTDGDGELGLRLAPLATPGPAATVARAWLDSRLRTATPGVTDALLALAASVGASAVLVVNAREAELLTVGGERLGVSAGAPLRALIARLDDDGRLRPEPLTAPAPPRDTATDRRWWLWVGAGAGAVVAGVVAAAVWASAGDSRLRVFAPEP